MNRQDIDWAGNFTAIVTPFAKNGDIDKTAFQDNINLLIEEGVNGALAEPNDPQSLAETLNRTLPQDVLEPLGRGAARTGAEHAWQKICTQYVELYRAQIDAKVAA